MKNQQSVAPTKKAFIFSSSRNLKATKSTTQDKTLIKCDFYQPPSPHLYYKLLPELSKHPKRAVKRRMMIRRETGGRRRRKRRDIFISLSHQPYLDARRLNQQPVCRILIVFTLTHVVSLPEHAGMQKSL